TIGRETIVCLLLRPGPVSRQVEGAPIRWTGKWRQRDAFVTVDTDVVGARLRVLRSGSVAAEIALSGTAVRIGRSTDSDIVVNDERASRRHAVIEPMGDGLWRLTDL